MTNRADLRNRFEKWVSAPPREYDVTRYPQDTNEPSAWPGQYKHIAVQLAWEACQIVYKAGFSDGLKHAAGWGVVAGGSDD